MASLLKRALWYAETMGWAVLPLHTPNSKGKCSCTAGSRCTSSGKHPRNHDGVHGASKDKAKIRDWWREWPDSNIGLASGEVSGVIVIDIDPRNGGRKSLQEFREKPPKTLMAKTGNGWHYFADYVAASIDHRPADGIDIQSDNRIVVLPPSLHESGKRYKWIRRKPNKLMIGELGELPSWAIQSGMAPTGEGPDPKGEWIREGERNEKLTSVAGHWRRAGMAEAEMFAALNIYNRKWCIPPLDDNEVHSIAHSLTNYTPTDPFVSAANSLTELGLAKRFEALHSADLRFSDSLGWLEWDGRCWQPERRREALARVRDVSDMLRDERKLIEDEKERKPHNAAIRTIESARGASDVVKISESLNAFSVDESWDSAPWLFNVQNGTLDLRRGFAVRFREHRREDYLTKVVDVAYDKDAKAPLFRQFLQDTFEGDEELITWIQKLFGYFLTGSVSEQIFPIFWGVGGNGKTTLLEDVAGAIYGKYRVEVSAETLLEKRYASHPTELMDLRGARLAIARESAKKKALDEEVIKRLTGGDTIKARRMHRNFEEFSPTHKLILVTNHKPRTSTDTAIWRRLRLVPFNNVVAEADRDTELGSKLGAEASGILNWAVAGCIKWQKDGLEPPQSVLALTEQHKEDQDVLGIFFREGVLVGSGYKCSAGELYDAYKLWAADNNLRPLGKINFSKEVIERFPTVRRYTGNGIAKWRGIRPPLIVRGV